MSTSQKHVCCVRGCSSIQTNVHEKLFVFPPNTDPRGKIWFEMYPNSFGKKTEKYICGRHFTAECFNKKGALLHKAVPSVNIDTSFAQDFMMRRFLMKVIYEWVLRNSVDEYILVVWNKVLEAKDLLGMQMYTQKPVWTSKFVNFKFRTDKSGKRFGSGQNGAKNILGIIKDIRQELPSNFVLPSDKDTQCTSGKVIVKEEDEDNALNSIFEHEEPADDPIEIQHKDVVPQNSLDTYKEALELLKPLKDYIQRIGNDNASLRLTEIETVVKQVIKNESKKPKRASKRRR